MFGVLLWDLGATPLTDVDEGAFAEATREMWVRGDFISPWLLDKPRFDKPILIHWMQMVSMGVFGFNSFGARLPSAIAGVFWILAIGLWAKTIAKNIALPVHPERIFCWALVISAFSIAIPVMSRSATADATLNALICWAIYFCYRVLTTGDARQAVRLTRCAAVCIGFGILTKGPIAILIPAATLLLGVVALKAQNAYSKLKMMFLEPWSWGLALLIPAPWYWLQYQAQGEDFIRGFLGTHNIGRFVDTMHGFSGGAWYYPAWMLIALLPFSLLVMSIFTGIRTHAVILNRHLWMCWGNALFVVGFFSISATKLPHYGFYGLPGVIVLMAIYIASLDYYHDEPTEKQPIEKRKRVISFPLMRLSLAAVLVALIILPWVLESASTAIRDPYISLVVTEMSTLLFLKIEYIIGLGFVGLLVAFKRSVFAALAISGFIFSVLMQFFVVKSGIEAYRGPIRDLSREIDRLQIDVSSWRMSSPSLSFQLDRVVPEFDGDGNRNVVILLKDKARLSEWVFRQTGVQAQITLLWEHRGVALVRVD